jgi:biotin operon repressor
MKDNLPNDPIILLSFINMKLRDEYSSLDELCLALNVSRKSIEETLSKSGFEYNQEENKFW